jgi:hypothetical protein
MRSSTLQVLYLFGSLAYASAIPDATAKEDLIAREDFKVADSLDARAACKCKKVSNAGLYCGFCPAANGLGYITTVPNENVAWCNKDGECKDFGYSSHCAAGETNGCIGINEW